MVPVLRSEDRMDHAPDSVSRCRELIAVAVSQIDGDPIVCDRLVDPTLEITVAHFKKIIALQRAGRRNPMTHENAEDLTANILVGRSVKHGSTIGFRSPSLLWPHGLHRPTRLGSRGAPTPRCATAQSPVSKGTEGRSRAEANCC